MLCLNRSVRTMMMTTIAVPTTMTRMRMRTATLTGHILTTVVMIRMMIRMITTVMKSMTMTTAVPGVTVTEAAPTHPAANTTTLRMRTETPIA